VEIQKKIQQLPWWVHVMMVVLLGSLVIGIIGAGLSPFFSVPLLVFGVANAPVLVTVAVNFAAFTVSAFVAVAVMTPIVLGFRSMIQRIDKGGFLNGIAGLFRRNESVELKQNKTDKTDDLSQINTIVCPAFREGNNDLVLPKVENDKGNQQEYTLGDLDGNSLRLLRFLCGCGITFTSEHTNHEMVLQEFEDLYNEAATRDAFSGQWEIKDKNAMCRAVTFIASLNIESVAVAGAVKPLPYLRFIGDMLADRGKNDWFTLLLLEKLSKAGIPYSIQLSNHDLEFIARYQAAKKAYKECLSGGEDAATAARAAFKTPQGLLSEQYPSILFFAQFLETSDDQMIKDMMHIVDTCYLPKLKVLDYNVRLGAEGNLIITTFTHAAPKKSTQEYVNSFEQLLGVEQEQDQDLWQRIDNINAVFSEKYITGEHADIKQIIPQDEGMPYNRVYPAKVVENPGKALHDDLYDIIYNRRDFGTLFQSNAVMKELHVFGHVADSLTNPQAKQLLKTSPWIVCLDGGEKKSILIQPACHVRTKQLQQKIDIIRKDDDSAKKSNVNLGLKEVHSSPIGLNVKIHENNAKVPEAKVPEASTSRKMINPL
jgi:succinate dehydrogenase flavin-adding protein (antitoxin of CptAB toxin-antitoxin module)